MSIRRQHNLGGIFRRTALAMVLVVAATAVFVAKVVSDQAHEFQTAIEHKLVLRGSDAIALSFNTALMREWDSMHAVARSIGTASQDDINKFMDAVARTGGQVAWAGFAAPDGTIISGSNGYEVGKNVSSKRWFRDGIRVPSVDSITETATNAQTGKMEYFLNLSTPVKGANGQKIGVLVYRVRIAWVRSFLFEASKELGIDVVVQDINGDTVIDTRHESTPLPKSLTSSASLRSKSSGVFHLVDGKDGGTYAFAPDFVWNKLPNFGWRVFAVLRRDNISNDLPVLTQVTLATVAAAALCLLGVTLVFLKLLLRPVERLAEDAKSIANGKYVFPEEATSSQEAASLSSALAIIQSKLTPQRSERPPRSTPEASPEPHS
ncbi:hypothetical protein BMI86_00840 [Thioclava sp. DLFJ5-1]|uniref:cache domain-containing protein n=1 Tax=Thioclava sp. DLFJ5-1 TaxID=1915314 RepID=UPI0009C91CFC|nr:cache domain-containing protein [Thioclava sp. DLFJ5-1]OOY21163.1 hypothetical protein BMI86_00840 [Thioclava sp. DLFJ5-1]